MSVNRGHKLRFLHTRRELSGEAYEVKVPRKVCRFFTAHSKTYLTLDHHECGRRENDHWFVMLTNRPDGHQRCDGGPAVAVDFRASNGTLYQRPELSGVWESTISMWPVEEEGNKRRIFNHVARVIDLAYEEITAHELAGRQAARKLANQGAPAAFWSDKRSIAGIVSIVLGVWVVYTLHCLYNWGG